MSIENSVTLQRPAKGPVDLLVIAAEHSGDEHAGRMVREVMSRRPGTVVAALGGPRLAAAGAELLKDLTASSAMGFAVVAKISYYKKLIAEIVRWIGEHRPRAVCFVDSSGLNLRIAEQLFARGISAKAGGTVKTLYYISPQVWASRAGRRFKMAEHLDGLASIFPFERKVYADTKLPVTFVGHPFVATDYAAPVSYDAGGPVLLLPGSRRGPVARIFPVLVEAFERAGGAREAVVLYPSEEIRRVVEAELSRRSAGKVTLVNVGEASGPVRAAAVLTTSGTMSMHCALAGIPGAITYRTDPLTYAIGRMVVKVKFIGIANLLLGEEMYPEFVQGAATPEALAGELRAALEDPARRERTAEQARRLRELLSAQASGSAAEWVLKESGLG
jgi:Lipid A disaccharide synthetase